MKPPLLLLAALCAAGCSKEQPEKHSQPQIRFVENTNILVLSVTNGFATIHGHAVIRVTDSEWSILTNAFPDSFNSHGLEIWK